MSTSASPKRTVFATRKDRLTSRLEGLLSVWRFARLLDRNTVIHWPPLPEDQAYFSSLIFDLEAMARDPATDDLKLIDQKYEPRTDVLDLNPTPEFPDKLDRDKLKEIPRNLFLRSQADIQFREEKTADIETDKKRLYALIKPHPVVQAQLAKALEWIGPGEFVGVHIRRGDLISNTEVMMRRYLHQANPRRPGTVEDIARAELRLKDWIHHFVVRAAPTEAYIDGLKWATWFKAKKPRVIIFSDSETYAREFQRKCPGYTTLLMSDFSAELSEIQRAYLEMLILSRSRRIISTRSTFSLFASFYGNTAFTNVQLLTSRAKMRVFFRKSFREKLRESRTLEVKCEKLLDACLGPSKILKLFIRLFTPK